MALADDSLDSVPVSCDLETPEVAQKPAKRGRGILKGQKLSRNPEAERQLRLLKAGLVKPDRGGIQEDVEWVYQNLNVSWHQIPVESVPSPGAVALLEQAKGNKMWFLEKYHARLLPTRAKIDAGDWSESDDGQVAEMVARVKEEMAIEEAEV